MLCAGIESELVGPTVEWRNQCIYRMSGMNSFTIISEITDLLLRDLVMLETNCSIRVISDDQLTGSVYLTRGVAMDCFPISIDGFNSQNAAREVCTRILTSDVFRDDERWPMCPIHIRQQETHLLSIAPWKDLPAGGAALMKYSWRLSTICVQALQTHI